MAAQLLLLKSSYVLLKLKQKKTMRALLKEKIEHIDSIPENILQASFDSELEFRNYVLENDKYARESFRVARQFIDDLAPGYQHHDIHCISFKNSCKSLIGYSIEEFSNLLEYLEPYLKIEFPKSPFKLGPNEVSIYCSIRFKLFIVLFRLKQGCSYRHLEKIFGWNKASIDSWYMRIINIIVIRMKRYHEGLIKYMGKDWQKREIISWKLKHLMKDDYVTFEDRINAANEDARSNGYPLIFSLKEGSNDLNFIGSLGATDCTYSIRPNIERSTLENNNEDVTADRIYSEYVKEHAYKLCVISSHGTIDYDNNNATNKLILRLITIIINYCSLELLVLLLLL